MRTVATRENASASAGQCSRTIGDRSASRCVAHAWELRRAGYDVELTEGVRRECLVRSTFVIDKKGVIRHAAYNVNPRGHAAEVYDLVRRLRS